MKNKNNYLWLVLLLQVMGACTPEEYTFVDNRTIDPDSIAGIRLQTNHTLLLADGRAQIEMQPVLLQKDGNEVLRSRIDDRLIEYRTLSGESISRVFATSAADKIGEKIEVYAQLKGKGLVSDTVAFEIVAPWDSESLQEISVPVVFHVIQVASEVESYGGEFETARLHSILEKLNNAFSGNVSHNPVGVDSKIRFKPALYDPDGQKLREPGIHRLVTESVSDAGNDQYETFLKEQKLVWPYDRYMNIWLVSDKANKLNGGFYFFVTSKCIPRYLTETIGSSDIPAGLSLQKLPSAWQPSARETGIIYRLETLNKLSWVTDPIYESELVFNVGEYLGLKRTWGKNKNDMSDDHCQDTQPYYLGAPDSYKGNKTMFKAVGSCFFLAENIMDDQSGVHRSVSAEQAKRMRWVLENCPERSAWKSDFAFTGK